MSIFPPVEIFWEQFPSFSAIFPFVEDMNNLNNRPSFFPLYFGKSHSLAVIKDRLVEEVFSYFNFLVIHNDKHVALIKM